MRIDWLTMLGFVSVAVLLLLIERTNVINASAHDEYYQTVRELREVSSDLVDAVEDSRDGDLGEHAEIDSTFVRTRGVLPNLWEQPRFVRPKPADSMDVLLRGFEVATDARERMAFEFKQANLRLHSSLDALRPHMQQAVETVFTSEINPRRGLDVHQFSTRWLDRARRGGSRNMRSGDSAFAALKAQATELSPSSRHAVEQLLSEFAHVRADAVLADSLEDAIDEAPGSDNSIALRSLYDAELDLARNTRARAQRWLAFYATFLLIVTFWVLYRLQRSRRALNEINDELEAKVRERTAALEKAARELERARDEALQASVAKSQFLANMSHELRTPLNSVIGFTNILLKNKRGALVAQELGFLNRIVENGKHLLSLINDILDLSKIEAGKVELELAPVCVDQLVIETVMQFGNDPKGNGVKLQALVPENVPALTADAGRLKQILINLVGNALKFTDQGSVTVALRLDVKTRRPARIEVIDTGIGIPQDRLGAIFEAFQQADSSTSRRFGGTGLGLAISNSLAQLMGCRIEVSSVQGEGSTFTIVLPALEAGNTEGASAPLQPSASQVDIPESAVVVGKELVLVIDDDADSRLLITQILEEANYEILAANSGPQGLRMAKEFAPRAILLDLMMPGMSGFDVLKELKNDPNTRDIPVVVVSMVARDYAGSVLGAVDVVEKPLSAESLLTAIRRNVPQPVRRILVVDDDRDTRRLISSYLTEQGAVVEHATNGFEALAALARFAPDAVIIDLMMPGMAGDECLRTIRRNSQFLSIPIVVVTAKDLTATELSQLKVFATEVLKKGGGLERDLQFVLASCLRRPTTVEEFVCA